MRIGATSYVTATSLTAPSLSTRHKSTDEAASSATQVSISSAGRAMAQGTLIPIDMSYQSIHKPDAETMERLNKMLAEYDRTMRDTYSPHGVSNYEQGLINAGNARQNAVIRLNGKIVGSFSDQGSFFASNAMGESLSSANGDQAAMTKLLKDKYGSSVDIQNFAPGTGPTWAELEKSMRGTDYFSRIPGLVAQFRQEAADWLRNNPVPFGA